MREDLLKTLLSEEEILSRLDEIAREVTEEFRGRPLTVVGILNGSCLFLGDLLRRIPLPLKVDCIRVASYHGGTQSTGEVTLDGGRSPDVRDRDVLLVDDILDTGRTLAAVKRLLLEQGGARAVKTCVLLRKDVRRAVAIDADYVGFDIPNEFVVGYGLDYMEHYRNLPLIGVLRPEAIERRAPGGN